MFWIEPKLRIQHFTYYTLKFSGHWLSVGKYAVPAQFELVPHNGHIRLRVHRPDDPNTAYYVCKPHARNGKLKIGYESGAADFIIEALQL